MCSLRAAWAGEQDETSGPPAGAFGFHQAFHLVYLFIKPKATGGSPLINDCNTQVPPGSGGEASPWAQAASGSASGCVPARLRRPLGRHSLTQLPPCEVNPTGSPCPVFAGGGGPPCSAAVGAGGAGATGSRRSSTITQETRAQRGQETPAPGSTLDAELGLESCFPRAP